ncbi:polysaccharide deacetylase family protein [Paenibacillus solisilvae]|uniref:Polysaccharide deacetylase family protein n=1 Tax=Paenibacillus solisilvae TaxID=2486751 RepID=A0ABW0VY80_9BACL
MASYMRAKAAAAIIVALTLTTGCAASPKESVTGKGNSKAPHSDTSANRPVNQPGSTKSPEKEPQPSSTPAGGTNEAANPADPNAGAANQPPAGGKKPSEAAAKLYRMNKVYRFEPISKAASNKVVLLTFDDGPKEDEMITGLLDTLDKHKAKAIFFVNGYRVKKHPELLKKIADRGQTIGNHSWDHIDLKKETPAVVMKQIADVQKIVKETIGKSPTFFRPPFGSGGDAVKQAVKKEGMLFMTWSNGSLDWDKSTKDKPELVIQNVLDQLHPGANILMHELPWTVNALDSLLTKLEQKGYGFIDPASIDSVPAQPKSAK